MRYLCLFIITALGCAALADEKSAKRTARTPKAASAPASADASSVPATALGDVRKAQAAFAQGDLPGAQRAYEQALAKAPENAYLLTNLGVVRFRDGRFAQAE